MPTSYEPYDGDYTDADYTKLLNDIQSENNLDIGAHLEICVNLTDKDKVYILCSNDEGTEWEFDYVFPVPSSWSVDTVRDMFSGYAVYLQVSD
jgi:hypothetical protein